MPLIIAPLNQELKIIKILTDEKTKKHLESLGITINSTLKVVGNTGNIIVSVKEGRLALDKGLATKIIVA
ncbi:MAG: ferrous iron transport protein A [Acholeplasmatales bacterium]|nr:ferrous iron transport protein A [Acholeplasmatales bacterium]